MRNFLFTSLFAVAIAAVPNKYANAQTGDSSGDPSLKCENLQIEGTWKMSDHGTFFGKHWRTYKISQEGCYVLVYDTFRKATWKIDLSGQHKIRVPQEQIDANLHGGGATAAKNMANLEVTLKPIDLSESRTYYRGFVSAEPYLEEQKSFPVSLKAHFGAELFIDSPSPTGYCPPICQTYPQRIGLNLTEFQVLDITKGLPSNIDKESFLGGLNMLARMFLKAFSYKMTLLDLVKDQ